MALEPGSHVTTHIWYVVGLALRWPCIPFVFEMMALRRMPLGPFSILMSLEPVFGALVGYVILHQALSPSQLAGVLAVMIAGIGAVVLSREPKGNARNARGPMQPQKEAC